MQVRALRGATTVEKNDANEILLETKHLLERIIEENDLKEEDIASVIFTVTQDLNAAFPAVAARQIGWTNVALMCMVEIDVPGSLRSCVRILIHFNTDKPNSELNHVYLKGAEVLRPDLKNKL